MEGISGVVQPAQLGPDGFEYQRAREWMTAEVNAAITGIRDSGPAEVVVCDSHGNGQSVLIADPHRPRSALETTGLDSAYDDDPCCNPGDDH
jgi:D-aminopeptidase